MCRKLCGALINDHEIALRESYWVLMELILILFIDQINYRDLRISSINICLTWEISYVFGFGDLLLVMKVIFMAVASGTLISLKLQSSLIAGKLVPFVLGQGSLCC